MARQSDLSQEHQGPRAVLNALERLIGGYGPQADRVRGDLAIAQSQLRDYQARLDVPFPHDDYLKELSTLREQLKGLLSGRPTEAKGETPPSQTELAESIKALLTAHNNDATPQRVQMHSTAEEPVTARIRRRTESAAESNSQTVDEEPPEPVTPADPAVVFRHGTFQTQPNHRHRVTANRDAGSSEPSLP
jgi:hypothetical protein